MSDESSDSTALTYRNWLPSSYGIILIYGYVNLSRNWMSSTKLISLWHITLRSQWFTLWDGSICVWSWIVFILMYPLVSIVISTCDLPVEAWERASSSFASRQRYTNSADRSCLWDPIVKFVWKPRRRIKVISRTSPKMDSCLLFHSLLRKMMSWRKCIHFVENCRRLLFSLSDDVLHQRLELSTSSQWQFMQWQFMHQFIRQMSWNSKDNCKSMHV